MRAIGGKGTKFGTNFQVFLQLFMVFKQNNLYLAPLLNARTLRDLFIVVMSFNLYHKHGDDFIVDVIDNTVMCRDMP